MKNLLLKNPSRFMALASILLVALFVFAPVYASTITDVSNATDQAPTTVDGVLLLVQSIFQILFVLLIIAAGIFIILAAFSYLTANGEPEKIQKATHRVIYAAVAIAVAVFAKAIPSIVANFITTGAH